MLECFGDSRVGTSGVNGDAFYISPDASTLVLADGASGAGSDGKVWMSRCCVENAERFPFSSSGLTPRAYIDALMRRVNDELTELSRRRDHYIFGTLVLCVVSGGVASFASAGDSLALLAHGGRFARVGRPVKLYDNLIRMGLYTREQLEAHVRALPEHMWSMFDVFLPMIVPSYCYEERRLSPGDLIALCCDGVSDFIPPEELPGFIDAGDLPGSVARVLDAAGERAVRINRDRRRDDLTLVLCHYDG